MSEHTDVPGKPNDPRELLKQAKQLGMDDATAARHAALTPEELRERVARDPSLGRLLAQARAQGLGDHLKMIGGASQWQAHQYAIETLFADALPGKRGEASAVDRAMIDAFRLVAARMTAEQVARAPDILELGRQADLARQAPAPLCLPTPPTPNDASP